MSIPVSVELYIEQDGNQFNDLWLACAVIFGVLLGFSIGVVVLFICRKNFPAKYTRADAQRLAESGLQPSPEAPGLKDEDSYSEIVPPAVSGDPVLTADFRKPLSWVRRQSTVDLGQEVGADGVIDTLAQETSTQMQLALVSQEFRSIVQWEEELQSQYRKLFLNLININLDSLVQQKVIEPEMKQTMSMEYDQTLKSTEREWKDKISASFQDYQQGGADPMQSDQIENMRFSSSMALEETMLSIREQIRKDLTVKTHLKPEEIDFMEEKLVENLTALCEIINAEYVSISKAQSSRYDVARTAGSLQFSQMLYETEEVRELKTKFAALLADLKTTYKLSASTVSKQQKLYIERVDSINNKYNEEFNLLLQESLSKCAIDRTQQLKRITTWKRSTEIASTSNQSYQAAVDGLIEPSRYVSTMHELQRTVRLDKMLATKRIDGKEGGLMEQLVKERASGKQNEYLASLQDAIGALKLEKNMDETTLNKKSKTFQDEMAQHQEQRIPELLKFVDDAIEDNVCARGKLGLEIHRQSADQEEMLGEQEDAVKEVLQTQSGLSEIDREHMMSIHQHQALSVINMLFMSRLRSMKRIEMRMMQDKNEFNEVAATLRRELTAAVGATGSKPLSKKQQKTKAATEKKHEDILAEKKKGMILSSVDAINALRQEIFEVTGITLKHFDERMGELLAKLQVSHARKEGTKVKSSQVLDKIKTKLVDMIWQDGYIPEASCKKTLQEHHKIVQDVSDKFAQKKGANSAQIEKVIEEKKMKLEAQKQEEINQLIENYKNEEYSHYDTTEPLWNNWTKSSKQVDTHNSNMELTRQIQDLYNNIEDDFARELHEEEINIILELVKMGRLDVNEFDKIIKTSVTACVGGDKLYQELSKSLLERYGQTAKRTDKALMFWEVATDKLMPGKQDPKVAAERAANVWRARLGIYDDRKR